jgi:hypothetical protein
MGMVVVTVAGLLMFGLMCRARAQCDNGTVEPPETCDPPGSPCGALLTCSSVCQCTCGDGMIDPGEQCDPPGSACGSPAGAFLCNTQCACVPVPPTTTTTTVMTTTTTTPPSCGNGTVEPPETCDPPGSPCGAFLTCAACQCTCGNGIIDPGEECDPPGSACANPGFGFPGGVCTTSCACQCAPTGPENSTATCSDMIDNDCNGHVDCEDPGCVDVLFPCNRAGKDPTVIKFGRGDSLDLIRGHAKLDMAPVDIATMRMGILLTNTGGPIYSSSLGAGALTPNPNGTSFRYSNPDARTAGGIYTLKITRTRSGSYSFSFASYGNLSAATDPLMRLQYYVGEDPNAYIDRRIFITKPDPWRRTPSGWRAPKDH